MNRLARSVLLVSLLASACGGVAAEGRNDESGAGTGGSGNGGGAGGKLAAGGKGGAGNLAGGGSAGVAGASGGGGIAGAGGATCCTALPTCNDGDQPWGFACPPDASCYPVTACCTTIYCGIRSTCPPTPCPTFDQQILGPCPPGRVCYQNNVCGSIVTCLSSVLPGPEPLPDAGSCGGAPPRGVHYVSTSNAKCQVIDYQCPAGTSAYSDGCGCGCRQPDTCPDNVNCQPGPPPGQTSPLCGANSGLCPYTIRAY